MSRAVALLVVVLALFAPASAVAQNPFGPTSPPLQPQPEPQQQAPPIQVDNGPSATDDTDDGLSDSGLLIIAGSALVILCGIGWFIARDSRRNAPGVTKAARAKEQKDEATAETKAQHRQQRQQQSRKRAKAAKQQRKRNRAR